MASAKMDLAKPVSNKAGLQQLLDSMSASIAEVLPKHITPKRVAKMALVAASKQPKLYNCTLDSLAKSIMSAAELGLDCSGTLGSAWIVPYGNTAQLIPGYRGLIDLARRSGQIRRIEAHPVYQNDKFSVEFGTEPRIIHRPELLSEPGPMVGVYAVAELSDGCKQVEFMSKAQVDKIRKASKAGNNGPWVDHYDEMSRKTVVRRLCKYLPLSTELETALALDNDAEGGDIIEGVVVRDADHAESLVSRLKGGELSEPEPEPQEADIAGDASERLVEYAVEVGAVGVPAWDAERIGKKLAAGMEPGEIMEEIDKDIPQEPGSKG